MCGIAGIINYQEYDLEKLRHSLMHRGPDDHSIYYHNNLALVHTRLSIQDIDHGKQPMHYAQYTIIFNGEIYNHLELRQYLTEFNFNTLSDTETLLYLYVKFKDKVFDFLDGMYAFAILDKTDNTVMLARDRSGKKPLYYFNKGSEFMFASELNSLKAIKKLEINEDTISSFLRNGFFFDTVTPYKSVTELSAGSYLIIDLVSLNTIQRLHFDIVHHYKRTKTTLSLKEATEEVDSLLIKSVQNRLLSSDLEVGAFLSGGIDSNLIVAIASSIKPDIKTFTVKFNGSKDESPYARLTATRYHTKHNEVDINITNNLVNDIEAILMNYGEPFADSSAIPSYYVAQAARKHVKVILNGDGADELFGGYRRYVPFANNWLVYGKYLSWLRHCLPTAKKRSFSDFLKRLLNMSTKSGLNLYLSATTDIFEDVYVFPENALSNAQNNIISNIMNNKSLSTLSKIMCLDFSQLLSSTLLVKMDIATMANSLEGRSPFLSKYLLEYAPTLPDKYKINRFTTKFILRNLAKKYLDDALITLPKRGFEVPLKDIIDNVLHHKIRDYLHGDCYVKKFINNDLINALFEKKTSISDDKRTNMLWSLFCVEVWYRNDQKIITNS
jgi:asparagine synthase (glutamine-hydrolysing)